MALTRVWMPSPNYSSRGGSAVRLIIIHSSEGAQTYQSLGNFFSNPSSQVSSHVGIDSTPNTIGEYVSRPNKAWTAANANPVAIQAELCTPSGASVGWSTSDWNARPVMLSNLAQWIAEEAAYYNIPIVRLTASQAQTNGRGVCQHLDLGGWGGGHVDCGPGFPIDAVIAQAAGSKPPSPPTPEEPDMKPAGCVFTMDPNQQQYFAVDNNGTMLHWYTTPGKPWIKESLGGGWDADSQLLAYQYGNTWQVWGVRSNGQRAQIYWSGTRWVTQPLP